MLEKFSVEIEVPLFNGAHNSVDSCAMHQSAASSPSDLELDPSLPKRLHSDLIYVRLIAAHHEKHLPVAGQS